MHMNAVNFEQATPLGGDGDDPVAMRGFALGVAISLPIWLLPLTWLLLG